jgi:hypothetical protein
MYLENLTSLPDSSTHREKGDTESAMADGLKRGGTRLSTIPRHTLWVWCQCGHNGGVTVSSLLDRPNVPKTVGELVAVMRCSRCKRQTIKDYVITYSGGSWEALQGTRKQDG